MCVSVFKLVETTMQRMRRILLLELLVQSVVDLKLATTIRLSYPSSSDVHQTDDCEALGVCTVPDVQPVTPSGLALRGGRCEDACRHLLLASFKFGARQACAGTHSLLAHAVVNSNLGVEGCNLRTQARSHETSGPNPIRTLPNIGLHHKRIARIMLAPGLWEQILDYLGERPFRTPA